MKRPVIIIVPLLLTSIGSLFWAFWLRTRLHDESARSAVLASELVAARAPRPAPAPAPVIRPAPAPSAAAPTVAKKEELPAFPGPPAAFLDNPAIQGMMAAGMRESLDRRYGSLFRKLQLAPGQLDRLKALLTDRQMSALDVVRAAQAQGLSNSEINALLAESGASIDTNIRALLGEPGFAQLQDYEAKIGAHGLFDQLETRLGFNNSPLTSAQSDAVLRLIDETSDAPPGAAAGGDPLFRVMQGMGGGPPMMSALSEPRITDRTIEAARAVLNPTQVEALVQLRTEQEEKLSTFGAMGGGFMPGPRNMK